NCIFYYMIFRCLLEQASLAFREGNRDTAIDCLKECFALGREKGYLTYAYWLHDTISEMCVKALEENIETEYVRYNITKLNLLPEEPPYHLDNWPWQARIKCLGHFE